MPYYGNNPSAVILNQRVYAASQGDPIAVYDFSDLSAPVLISQGEDSVWDLVSANDLVYVAAGTPGLAIYDSQGPSSLLKRGSLLGIGTAEDVAVQGKTLFIADGGAEAYSIDYLYGGLAVATVQQPGQAEVIGKFEHEGHGAYIEMEGEQAYLIAGYCVLRYTQCWQSFDVMDVVNPQFPSLLGSYGIEKHDPGPPYAEPVSIQNNIHRHIWLIIR